MNEREPRLQGQNLLERALHNKAVVAGYSLFMAVCAVIAVLSMIAPWTQREIPLLQAAGKLSPYTSLAACISNLLMLVGARSAFKAKKEQAEVQEQQPETEEKP